MRRGDRERRVACRYDLVDVSAGLGWWERAEFSTAPAVVKNISVTGALVETRAAVPVGTPVWLRLGGACETGWVAGELVGRQRVGWQTYRSRVHFLDPSAVHLFEAAVHHLSKVRNVPGYVATEFDNRDWR